MRCFVMLFGASYDMQALCLKVLSWYKQYKDNNRIMQIRNGYISFPPTLNE